MLANLITPEVERMQVSQKRQLLARNFIHVDRIFIDKIIILHIHSQFFAVRNVHVVGGALPEKGEDTRNKISGAIDDFCKKHDIKLSKKDVDDLVDDIKDAATEV